MKPDAIILMGPTASGKTDLALSLCQTLPFDCEIISVDSALIYRQMDIGTAKPSQEELAIAPHHLIDILDPAQSYSAADFCRDATQTIAAIRSRGAVPVLVGGTMLYFKALLEGLSSLPGADPKVRAEIEAQAKLCGWPALHRELSAIDPVAAARIHPNDPQRLMRALEVYKISGRTLTELTREKDPGLAGRLCQFAIAPANRELLHQRIEQRFDMMLDAGFEQEVRALMARGDLDPAMPSVRCVGYRQMWEYLQGGLSYDEMRYRAVVATRQLAKKQMTWLKGWPDLVWLDSLAVNNCQNVMNSIELV